MGRKRWIKSLRFNLVNDLLYLSRRKHALGLGLDVAHVSHTLCDVGRHVGLEPTVADERDDREHLVIVQTE